MTRFYVWIEDHKEIGYLGIVILTLALGGLAIAFAAVGQ
jgi:hypothetical protein